MNHRFEKFLRKAKKKENYYIIGKGSVTKEI